MLRACAKACGVSFPRARWMRRWLQKSRCRPIKHRASAGVSKFSDDSISSEVAGRLRVASRLKGPQSPQADSASRGACRAQLPHVGDRDPVKLPDRRDDGRTHRPKTVDSGPEPWIIQPRRRRRREDHRSTATVPPIEEIDDAPGKCGMANSKRNSIHEIRGRRSNQNEIRERLDAHRAAGVLNEEGGIARDLEVGHTHPTKCRALRERHHPSTCATEHAADVRGASCTRVVGDQQGHFPALKLVIVCRGLVARHGSAQVSEFPRRCRVSTSERAAHLGKHLDFR